MYCHLSVCFITRLIFLSPNLLFERFSVSTHTYIHTFQSMVMIILTVLLTATCLSSAGRAQNISCNNSFNILEQDFLSRVENRYQITRTFYPPRDPRPVVVKIYYSYPDGTNQTWFWSESQFYLIQPLEIFQFTSLFFSNLPTRQTEVTIMLSQQCAGVGNEFMELLTQRVRDTYSVYRLTYCESYLQIVFIEFYIYQFSNWNVYCSCEMSFSL